MEVAWGRAKEVVRGVVKVDVKVVKAVVNKHARLCVVMSVVVAVEIHALHLVVETVAVHVEDPVKLCAMVVDQVVCTHVKLAVREHVKGTVPGVVQELFQIR